MSEFINTIEQPATELTVRSQELVRICILGATFDTANMGVGALAAGSVRCVLQQWPNAEIFFLDYGKQAKTFRVDVAGRKIEVPLVNIRFSKNVFLRNNIAWLIALALLCKLMPSRSLRKRILSGNAWLKRVSEADVVASIAGGDSFSDIYGLRRLAYVGLPQVLVELLGKELILLPQTLGPFRSRLARSLAKFILKRASIVYSRDEKGLREIPNDLGLRSSSGKFRFSYDIGFALEPNEPGNTEIVGLSVTRKIGVCRVGLNVSGLLWMGGYTGRNMFKLRGDYKHLIYRIIDRLIEGNGAEVLLVPHVFGSSEESDQMICEKLYEEIRPRYEDKVGLVRGHYDQGEIKYIIAGCDFFIGARMHACIAALSQFVPAVAIAYSDKFIGVLDTIGMKEAVADPRVMGAEEIGDFVDRMYQNRADLKQRLQMKMPDVKRNVLSLFADVEV
jgi:polysaccharide pyruvyl transferase WcaK-like protein